MRSTAIDRRTFLTLAGATLLAPGAEAASRADEALFLGARQSGRGFEAAVIDEAGRDRLVLPLQARGHSFAIDRERGRAVAFARAPGRFAVAFSLDSSGEPVAIAAEAGRHFYGHGLFTRDGRLMLATENDYDGARGVTGLYDAGSGFRRIGEFSTGGIEPHEALLMPDGRTLCAANGGIQTHPDYERVKLNLATMEPSLAYLDISTGEIVEQVKLAKELHQVSIRHMAVDAAGHVWFGCQYQGDPADRPALVGRHRRGRAIEMFPGPADVTRALDNYVGSVAVDASGTVVATSSPHGGVIAFWDAATGRSLGTRELADGCGVAGFRRARLIATSGRGAIVETGPDGDTTELTAPGSAVPAWDNHLRHL